MAIAQGGGTADSFGLAGRDILSGFATRLVSTHIYEKKDGNVLGNGGTGTFDAKFDFDGETGADMVTYWLSSLASWLLARLTLSLSVSRLSCRCDFGAGDSTGWIGGGL
jgi:hypothetical protein